jgi:hypothetical protein
MIASTVGVSFFVFAVYVPLIHKNGFVRGAGWMFFRVKRAKRGSLGSFSGSASVRTQNGVDAMAKNPACVIRFLPVVVTIGLMAISAIGRDAEAQARSTVKPEPEQAKPAAEAASKPSDAITYRGKVRTEKWLDDMHQKYGKFVYKSDNGEYVDLGKDIMIYEKYVAPKGREIRSTPPNEGDLKFCWYTVFQVISDSEALVETPDLDSKGDLLLHISGDFSKLVNGSKVKWQVLSYAGKHTYTATNGAKQTVQSYRILQSVSKDEFSRALNGGFVILERKLVKQNYKQGSKTPPNKSWIYLGDGYYKLDEKQVP